MSIERCCRCERDVDTDFDMMFYKMEYKFLEIEENEALCKNCLSEEDWDTIEEMEYVMDARDYADLQRIFKANPAISVIRAVIDEIRDVADRWRSVGNDKAYHKLQRIANDIEQVEL